MENEVFYRSELLNSAMQLDEGKILYYFADRAFICNAAEQYAFTEINDTENDILLAINDLHRIDTVWEKIRNDYSISPDDQEASIVFFTYLEKLIASKVIKAGTAKQKHFGERGKCYPFSFTVELTNKCNFRCTHCYKEAECKNSVFIDRDRVIDFVQRFKGKVYQIEFTGGEATLHPDFAEIVLNTPDNTATLLTNGSKLSNIPEEVLSKLSHIQVSLYGYTDKEYLKYACTDKFQQVCQGIRRTVELGIPCTVAIILRPENIPNMNEYIKLLHSMGVRSVRFGSTADVGRNSAGAWLLSRENCIRFSNIRETLVANYPDITFEDFDWQRDFDAAPLPSKETYNIVCDAGTKNVVISENGLIRPCVMMPADCFTDYSMESYLQYVEEGTPLAFDRGIRNCVNKFNALGKSLSRICPHAFA